MANPLSPPNGNSTPQSLDYLLPDSGGNSGGTGGNAGYIKRGKVTYSPTGAADKTANAVVVTHSDGDTFSGDPIEVVAAGVIPAGTTRALQLDADGHVTLGPDAGTDVTGSATGAASSMAPALPAVSGKTNYVTGFEVTGAGATADSVIAVTLTGTVTGTLNYRIAVPAGATTSITPLVVEFSRPIPASAVNTAITLNVASFGAGNTDAAAVIHGFVA